MVPVHLHFQHLGRDTADKAKAAARDGLDLRALAGLRALACLGILAGHLAYWVAAANPDKRKVSPCQARTRLARLSVQGIRSSLYLTHLKCFLQ